MEKELIKLKELILKEAENCRIRMLSTEDPYTYGYNDGAKITMMMIVNSINEILNMNK